MISPHRNTTVPTTTTTFFFAIVLLFFFQLVTMWIESIYRISLVKLGMGKELYGALFLFVPLMLFFVRKQCERGFLWAAMAVLLMARVLCPMLGTRARLVMAGLGVGAFLIVFCYAQSFRYRHLCGHLSSSVGLAVLLSIGFRSWRSSIDVSMDGTSAVLGCLLALLALHLFRKAMRGGCEPPTTSPASRRERTVALLGMFSNFTMIYLVLSSPAVVNAWNGGDVFGYAAVVGITATAFVMAFWTILPRTEKLSRGALFAVNMLFAVTLVGGIILQMPTFPMSAGTGPVFVDGSAAHARFVLYLALLLSPIVILNVGQAAESSGCARPRDAILPVTLGMAFLLLVAFILIFTNVWGYVPYGRLFRNKFFLPFLLAATGMLIPALTRRGDDSSRSTDAPRLGGLAGVVAILALAGVVWCGNSRPAPQTDPRRLTVMTYNFQQGSRSNGDRAYSEQLALLRRVNADMIGLQECDPARPSGGHVDVVRYFADALGYYAYYGPNTVSGTFGAAILSRYPIHNPRTFFTYSDSDEVGTAAADIDMNGTRVVFFSNHPSGAGPVMNAHVDALIDEARKYTHVIAVGDFNFTPREPYFTKLAQVLIPSADTLGEARVYNHGQPPNLANEIDHIFTSPQFRVVESHYLPPPDSVSDHPAHWSVFQISD